MKILPQFNKFLYFIKSDVLESQALWNSVIKLNTKKKKKRIYSKEKKLLDKIHNHRVREKYSRR